MTGSARFRQRDRRARQWTAWLPLAFSLVLFVLPAQAAEDRIPIFDAHLHYSRDAWSVYPPDAVVQRLDAAGVVGALVSSTPDDGTLMLYRHDSARVVPELRPYHDDVGAGNWANTPEVVAYLEARLANGGYRGIGEFHLLNDADARTATMRRVAALAIAHDIALHVHSDAGPINALFELEPELKILWAHAGFSEPADVVSAMLDRYPRLMTELSFRAHDIAPGGRLDPAWQAAFARHADRFLIGSDTYVTSRWDSYVWLIDEHRAWLAQLPPETARAIAFENAARVFGIKPPSQ